MSEQKLTQARLKELLHYDPDTGIWIKAQKYISRGRLSKTYGNQAGYISKSNGYRYIGINNIAYLSSRLVFLYVEGYTPENQVDHINRIRHDDRWINLRHVSASCNNRNVGIRVTNTSGITGVYWHKIKEGWTVCIHGNGKRINFNSCNNFDHAVKIRWEAEKKYNYPNCNSTSPAYLYLERNNLL